LRRGVPRAVLGGPGAAARDRDRHRSARRRAAGLLRHLRRIRAAQPPALCRLADMLFVVVSETLISGTLPESWRDGRVVPAVREVLGDHAEDEEHHHVYFTAFFELLWPRLTQGERAAVGPLIPGFIRGFLSPDPPAIEAALVRCGVRPADTARVL